ncbi:MAG: outer membrane lipoprotein carrier protein LolA [Candidatus Cloacimonadales bacterium]|jgi:outer membrane lipoprotein-sorting protein|nr:outer membrane lipoprotein carrier protein LolA [Candidatus Cloacimonadota bacterium]MDD2649883.1 outer membrane lipoprotein carrier protein LolA [Candidatus Cloacimonadota bacterium]MDD3501017.1 outer membrane lipoprotein carrier protein LolA [Candidatus Cloacimonadota bacterium]MDX9977098.1 outer membrane lipoprotein carrier protein LolA [Candidatus Cloacimonadales bacterium]
MRQTSIKVISVLLLSVLVVSLYANVNAKIDSVLEKYQNQKSFKIQVEQENHYLAQNIILKSSGFLYRQNEEYVLVFDKPHYQFVRINQESLTIYDSSIKTAYIFDTNQANFFNSLQIFSKKGKLKYRVKNNANPFNIVFTLTDDINEDLTIDFDFKGNFIKSIAYEDNLGNTVKINFVKHDFLGKINLGKFKIPNDTNIIKQ